MGNALLSQICDLLGEGGMNYSVFLRTYSVEASDALSSSELVCLALGPSALVGGVKSIPAIGVLPEIEAGLTYAGDSGAGPSAEVLSSNHFKGLLAELLSDVQKTVVGAQRIETFWLKDGHPAYPVFWDFAFLFRSGGTAVILIGSSSD